MKKTQRDLERDRNKMEREEKKLVTMDTCVMTILYMILGNGNVYPLKHIQEWLYAPE